MSIEIWDFIGWPKETPKSPQKETKILNNFHFSNFI